MKDVTCNASSVIINIPAIEVIICTHTCLQFYREHTRSTASAMFTKLERTVIYGTLRIYTFYRNVDRRLFFQRESIRRTYWWRTKFAYILLTVILSGIAMYLYTILLYTPFTTTNLNMKYSLGRRAGSVWWRAHQNDVTGSKTGEINTSEVNGTGKRSTVSSDSTTSSVSPTTNRIYLPSNLGLRTSGREPAASNYAAAADHKSTIYNDSLQSESLDSPRLICHTYLQRLGNQLFQYASILGLALILNRTAVFTNAEILDQILKVPSAHPTRHEELKARCTSATSRWESACCKFDQKLTELDPKLDYSLSGYLQSWKYFIQHEEHIKKALTFSDSIQNASSIITGNLRKDNSNCTLIGVHIRRGDFARDGGQKLGYVIATPDYLNRSFTYFRDRFSNSVFIVSSDDVKWCKSNIPRGFKVRYLENNSPAVDMATLSRLDHIITSFGTFSWWAGYFNPGIVVYIKDFIVPNSHIGNQFSPNGTDYIYPGWIPL